MTEDQISQKKSEGENSQKSQKLLMLRRKAQKINSMAGTKKMESAAGSEEKSQQSLESKSNAAEAKLASNEQKK